MLYNRIIIITLKEYFKYILYGLSIPSLEVLHFQYMDICYFQCHNLGGHCCLDLYLMIEGQDQGAKYTCRKLSETRGRMGGPLLSCPQLDASSKQLIKGMSSQP